MSTACQMLGLTPAELAEAVGAPSSVLVST